MRIDKQIKLLNNAIIVIYILIFIMLIEKILNLFIPT
jgi:hypothetical protein